MLQAPNFKDTRRPSAPPENTNSGRSSKAALEQESANPASPELGPQSAFSSTNYLDAQRRRRSHSECLFLAKTNGTQDLPGPCAEYISNVKQILARNDDQLIQLKRRRSMNLSHPSLFKQSSRE